ncbi:centromere/kinetochore protein zw10 homolog isoform X2 [Amborella trichopoda]|uniref:centromere/kinetochore protein zw10 homolog isoform X2 n=1 Tax=Amborella trichopoda TaxID=13333 RepID=UPI0009BF6560|nr:centromere/kinetochore protein zw10 homolog isoform X2 [Amborella trichopoda]|eukprot:XP_020517443.1 centromere/kinetochore protein zw10 homolog isoform X2 [Amborella trichopoda]
MDVLFGSIDIRDLLPNHDDVDLQESPLSAPDLRLLIDTLNTRSLHIKYSVHRYLLDHRQHFSAIFAQASNASSVSSELETLIQSCDFDAPFVTEIETLACEAKAKVRELKEKKEALDLVRVLAKLVEKLRFVEDDIFSARMEKAAEGLIELQGLLVVREEWKEAGEIRVLDEENEPVVFGLLRNKWMSCFKELQKALGVLLENAVQFELEGSKLRIRHCSGMLHGHETELFSVMRAMEIVGILGNGFAKIADLLIKHVVIPVVSASADVFVEVLSQDEAVLCVVPHPDSQAVPNEASKVAEFQSIVKMTAEFEATLKELMFISASDSKDERLSNFAQNVEVHFATKKRNEILARARKLLVQSEIDVPLEHAARVTSKNRVDLLFQSERCTVSSAATQLMELVHQTLQNVCMSPMRVAMEFYHAARDALLLYEVIVPVKLEKQLGTISRSAILMHNDCYYLSQEILGLAYEYRADFPSGIKERAAFVDLAPRFHQLAEEVLQRQIQLVLLSLKEAIDGADGFQNTHQPPQCESTKFCIDQVVFILEKARILWEPLLLPSTYKKSMLTILSYVFERITKEILSLDDIAADETLQLQSLIYMVIDNLSSVVEELVPEVQGSSEVHMWNQLEKLISSLSKLRKLADLLDMPLKTITTLWERGELVSCGFTLLEIQNFVKAIFADSPLRKECFRRIESFNLEAQ